MSSSSSPSAKRLLNELVESEPLSSLVAIIETTRAEPEASFISHESVTIGVTAAATATVEAAATATRRSTRARRAPERFAQTPSTRALHSYVVAGIHGHSLQGPLGIHYLVSCVGYDEWTWLPKSDLACESLIRQYHRNIAVADRWLAWEQSNDNRRPQAEESEVAAVHGCHTDEMGNYLYLLSWVGHKTGWQWVKEFDCSCDELTSAFFDMDDGACLPLEWN